MSNQSSHRFNDSQVIAFRRFLRPNIDDDLMLYMWSQLKPADRSTAAATLKTSSTTITNDSEHQERKILSQATYHRHQQREHKTERQSRRLHGSSEVS